MSVPLRKVSMIKSRKWKDIYIYIYIYIYFYLDKESESQ